MKTGQFLSNAAALLLAQSQVTQAITLDLTSTDSIKTAASEVAYDMMKYYTGNNTGDVPGNLPSPYYWWEAGAMFGAMIDYWYYTGDDTYVAETKQAMLHQVGTDDDYMPANQTKSLGNDDQGFWAMAAMRAAEVNFTNPDADEPSWLSLAQAVFNEQASRWDNSTCGGGLRWQIYTFNSGYTYKNAISNAVFFNVGSRLARYTNNDTYAQWAETTWDWVKAIGLIDDNYYIYDGTDDTENCSTVNHIQWTYNVGCYLHGAANMYNYTTGTEQAKWQERVEGLLNGSAVFFKNSIMYEAACEPNGKCDTDEMSFKAYLSRWMGATVKIAPFTYDTIMPLLQTSASAAAEQCSGGDNGRTCGLKWTDGATWDGTYGVGQQMAALEVIQANLVDTVGYPLTNTTGGTSVGNSAAGTSSSSSSSVAGVSESTITSGDRVGAGFLTTFVLIGVLGGAWWMVA